MGISSFPVPSSGIPSGNTAGRPASPVIGDTYYNGQKEALEIYNGTAWVFASAPSLSPTITVADVGTSRAYGSAQGLVTFIENPLGGPPEGYTVTASTGGYSTTTTSTTANITVGDAGSWTFSATAYNGFGTSSVSPSVTQTLTTVPQAPTIGAVAQVTSTTSVTVAWTLNNNGGKNLSAITITPYLNGTTAQTSQTAATTTSTTHTFTGLSYGSSYTFKVSATNANGVSLESSASGSVSMIQQFDVDFLVVAGGGSTGGTPDGQSAQAGCGGGGAGGFKSSVTTSGGNANALSPILITGGTNYTVTVGAGAAGAGSDGSGSQGSSSVFSNITSTGGGLARCQTNQKNGGSGGSGGGGSSSNAASGNGGAGTANEGFAGGNANSPSGSGAGGGGAGAEGAVNNGGNVGGAGGAGKATNINGNSVTYAGGGGGGNVQDHNPSTGGAGGGGAGGRLNTVNGAPINGTEGTGGGGGGGTRYWGGASGGSGVVILRYPDTATITVGAGLTSSTSAASGGYKRTTFNAGTGNVSW